jgi:DNA helicase-2/ATP-dependent DNA helicase PcrA
LVAYLRLIVNDKEEISFQRVIKIGKRKADLFFGWLGKYKSADRNDNPGKLLEEIINVTKYDDKFDEHDEEDLARIENINELLAVASEFSDLQSFLENAALSESEDKRKNFNAKITLMTIHAAKGLEFDNVFVVGLEEGLFPHSRTLMNRDEIEEERRLMYVAMTRAKTNLTVSFARSRLVYGGRQSPFPSRFLAEIPESLLKHAGKEIEVKKEKKGEIFDEFGEKKRIVVQDWEIEEATKDDFAEIDNW